MMARIWMVAYDISDDNRRRKVEKILSGFGMRVQKSVFECQIGWDDLIRVKDIMRPFLEKSSDSIRYYPICVHCQEKVVSFGKGGTPTSMETYLIL